MIDAQNLESPVEKIAFALVYAEDSKKTIEFYKKYLGFKEDPAVKMDGDQIFGNIGPVGLWIGGGYKKIQATEKDTRATAMLRVKSASQLFNRLKADAVRVFQEKPIKMNENAYWFQFADINGNVWDILGNE